MGVSCLKKTGILDDCPFCGSKHAISWDSDCTFSDLGLEGDGLITFMHCIVCNTDMEFRIPYNDAETGEKHG